MTKDEILVRLAKGRGVPLCELDPGDAFVVFGNPALQGTVVDHGSMGSRVRYGTGIKVTTVRDRITGEVKAEFESKVTPDIISGGTEVLPLG